MQINLPTLRTNLTIAARSRQEGGFNYLIKDQNSNIIYDLGEEEYFICKHLDGQTSLDSIQIDFENHFGFPLSVRQLAAFLNQLKTLGLLVGIPEKPSYNYQLSIAPFIKKLLFNPNRFLGLLATIFSWCFSRLFLFWSGLVFILAFGMAFKYFGDFRYEIPVIWQPGPFFLESALGIFFINLLGEISKGVACKHYGGNVYEFGIGLAYRIIPHFYIDLSNAIWTCDRSKQMRLCSAGLFIQALTLALAIIFWKHTAHWPGLQTFLTILIVAAFFFFLFNLIPLLPRDGYFLLSLWLEVPDLYNRSRALCRSWIFRRPLPEPLSDREILGFKWFGVLSVGLSFILWTLFFLIIGYLLIWHWQLKGVGAVIFLGLLTLRFEDQLKRWIMGVPGLRRVVAGEMGAIRLSLMVKLGLLALFIIIMVLPYPFEPGGEFKLIPIRQLAIRAEVPGRLYSVLVEENQWVNKGQVVAELSGKDQQARVQQARAAYEGAMEKLQMYYQGPKPEEIALAEQEVRLTAKSLEYSTIEAERAFKMFTEKALADKEYQHNLKIRDEDREKYILAKKNLQRIKSWPRPEEIRMQEAEVKRLKAELEHAEKNLHLTKLVSPMEGKIITAYPSQAVGQYMDAGDVFALVEDPRNFIAEIEVPEEDAEEVKVGARVKLKTWAYPTKTFYGQVMAIAPVGYEKRRHRVERAYSEKEYRFGQKEAIKEQGKVIRVLSEFPNPDGLLKTDMTGYAKIEGRWMPVGLAFTRWLLRFFSVEVWSWIP
jgi:putative peptide zinc metalloprotease protein